jgi:allophanate hydrolase subunit 2
MAPHPSAGIGPLGIVPGPDGAAAPPSALERLVDTSWLVSPAADRMGIRLAGPSLGAGGEIVSHPLLPGAVQLPPGGRPIVALVDGPTIGGYPVIGVVPAADLPRLGQMRPGDDVRFAIIEPELARALWRRQRVLFDGASATLEADDAWRRLADGAGG